MVAMRDVRKQDVRWSGSTLGSLSLVCARRQGRRDCIRLYIEYIKGMVDLSKGLARELRSKEVCIYISRIDKQEKYIRSGS